MSAAASSGIAFRFAAAALAGAPVGFAGGALLGGRLLTDPADPAAGPTILLCGAFGALFAAGLMAAVVALLTPKAARLATLAGGVASIAVVVYVVQDFIGDRMAQARAFDAAYQRMPPFEIVLEAENRNRSPFSKLQYESEHRQYTAQRPGGWLCQGEGNREQTMALFEALGDARNPEQANNGTVAIECGLRAAWRIDDVAVEKCLGTGDAALFAVADALVEATERRSSCRRLEE